MTLYDHPGYPVPSDERPNVTAPMWVALRVCECGRIGFGYATVRCGEDGRRNMRGTCPTVEVPYMQAEQGDIPEGM